MYGDFFLLERNGHPAVRARRLPLGDTAGRSEVWLRDTLFQHPQILPMTSNHHSVRSFHCVANCVQKWVLLTPPLSARMDD
jgi:hypothetical protein